MRDLWRGLGLAALLSTCLVVSLLLAGQLKQFADVIRAAGPALQWASLLRDAGLALAEAVLPLIPLVAAGLAYGRLRSEGGLVALAGLGVRPARLLAPALVFGLVCAGAAAYTGHRMAPRAATRLAHTLVTGLLSAATGAAGATRLPGGAVVVPDAAGLWLVQPGAAGATVLRARTAAVAEGVLRLQSVAVWRPGLRLSVETVEMAMAPAAWRRRLRQFAAPNGLPSAQLDLSNVHHRYVLHRRWAFAALAPLWALWGACLGMALGAARGTVGGVVLVTAAYGLLRSGELSARAGLMSPALAAWAPVLVLLGLLVLWAPRAAQRVDPAA